MTCPPVIAAGGAGVEGAHLLRDIDTAGEAEPERQADGSGVDPA